VRSTAWIYLWILWTFGSAAAFSADPSGKTDTVPGPEGQIAFEVKKGWVSFTLTKEGKGIPDALVEALDEDGVKFAEGTTGSKGQGQFPLPKGHQIKVEVKIGERSANTIVLTRIGDSSVVPQEVLLSYGSKPCCKWGHLPGSKIRTPFPGSNPSAFLPGCRC